MNSSLIKALIGEYWGRCWGSRYLRWAKFQNEHSSLSPALQWGRKNPTPRRQHHIGALSAPGVRGSPPTGVSVAALRSPARTGRAIPGRRDSSSAPPPPTQKNPSYKGPILAPRSLAGHGSQIPIYPSLSLPYSSSLSKLRYLLSFQPNPGI
jgi:hypothetical protein